MRDDGDVKHTFTPRRKTRFVMVLILKYDGAHNRFQVMYRLAISSNWLRLSIYQSSIINFYANGGRISIYMLWWAVESYVRFVQIWG